MNRKKMASVMGAILAMSLGSGLACAGSGSGLAAIEHIGVFSSTDVVFFYTAVHTGQPSCNAYRKRWALNISTPVGKAQYAYLLAAISAGREVNVAGTADCSLWSDSESVTWIGQPISYTGGSSDIPTF